MRVLICGGGVIGAATAYFLSRRRIEVTVIERTGVANAASGKSGGFLALDWCDGTPEAARRIERVLWNDPASGVMRHADAGYDIAIASAREHGLDLPSLK